MKGKKVLNRMRQIVKGGSWIERPSFLDWQFETLRSRYCKNFCKTKN